MIFLSATRFCSFLSCSIRLEPIPSSFSSLPEPSLTRVRQKDEIFHSQEAQSPVLTRQPLGYWELNPALFPSSGSSPSWCRAHAPWHPQEQGMCVARAQGTPCLAREQLLGDPKEAGAAQLPRKTGQRGSSCTFTPSLAFGISLLPLELCASADFSWGTKASPVGSSSPKQEIYAPFHGSGPPTEEISTLWMRSAGNAAGIIKDTCRWEKPFSHRSKPNFC